jgi:hypothetical protein
MRGKLRKVTDTSSLCRFAQMSLKDVVDEERESQLDEILEVLRAIVAGWTALWIAHCSADEEAFEFDSFVFDL